MNFILARLAPYKLLIEIVLIGSLVAGGLYAYNRFCESLREEGRAEIRAADAKLEAIKEAADRRVEQAWSNRADKAERDATEKQNVINGLYANSGRSLDGLQRAITAATNVANQPGVTIETLAKTNSALATVFTECAAEYRTVAKAADGHYIDWQTADAAFPTRASEGEVKSK